MHFISAIKKNGKESLIKNTTTYVDVEFINKSSLQVQFPTIRIWIHFFLPLCSTLHSSNTFSCTFLQLYQQFSNYETNKDTLTYTHSWLHEERLMVHPGRAVYLQTPKNIIKILLLILLIWSREKLLESPRIQKQQGFLLLPYVQI